MQALAAGDDRRRQYAPVARSPNPHTLEHLKRVVIVGRGVSGKSALAARLAEITGLPVVELDKLPITRPALTSTYLVILRHLKIRRGPSKRYSRPGPKMKEFRCATLSPVTK